ncbi:MAG TPA: hypothetical protein VE422_24465, partial [Terriglobia bacterium]|nr:hypothetical protein [Terriglobia bacterium]
MVEIISGFFFRRNASATLSAGSPGSDVAVEQLLTAAGYGMSIQIEQVRQKDVTASAKLDGFQTGVKAPLLLVQKAVEQQDRSFHFIGRNLKSGHVAHDGNGLRGSLHAKLPTVGGWINSG